VRVGAPAVSAVKFENAAKKAEDTHYPRDFGGRVEVSAVFRLTTHGNALESSTDFAPVIGAKYPWTPVGLNVDLQQRREYARTEKEYGAPRCVYPVVSLLRI